MEMLKVTSLLLEAHGEKLGKRFILSHNETQKRVDSQHV